MTLGAGPKVSSNTFPPLSQGDWGTQFGMLIQNIKESRENGLAGTTVEEVSNLQELYRHSKQRFDSDEAFKTRARESVKELQGGNPLYVEASFCRQTSQGDEAKCGLT